MAVMYTAMQASQTEIASYLNYCPGNNIQAIKQRSSYFLRLAAQIPSIFLKLGAARMHLLWRLHSR